MNTPLSTSYLYGSGLSPADEDLKILSADALERVLTSPWTIHEELKRVVVDGEIITQFDFFIQTDAGDRLRPFKSLSLNPYVGQQMIRHLCDCHNYRLHAQLALDEQEAKSIKTDILDEKTGSKDLF